MKPHLITISALCASLAVPALADTADAKPVTSPPQASMEEFLPAYKAYCQGYADLVDLLLSVTDKDTAGAAAPKIAELKAELEQIGAKIKECEQQLRKELENEPVEIEVASYRLQRSFLIVCANCLRLADTKPEPWYGSEELEKVCQRMTQFASLSYPQQLGARAAGSTAVVLNAGMDLKDILTPITTKEQADAAAPAVRKISQGYRIAKSESEVVVAFINNCPTKDKDKLNHTMHKLYFGMLHVSENADPKPAIQQYRRLMDSKPACYGSTDLQQALEEFHAVVGDEFFGQE